MTQWGGWTIFCLGVLQTIFTSLRLFIYEKFHGQLLLAKVWKQHTGASLFLCGGETGCQQQQQQQGGQAN